MNKVRTLIDSFQPVAAIGDGRYYLRTEISRDNDTVLFNETIVDHEPTSEEITEESQKVAAAIVEENKKINNEECNRQIEALKQQLSDTDYMAVKNAEYLVSQAVIQNIVVSDNLPVSIDKIEEREAIRQEIRDLENQIESDE